MTNNSEVIRRLVKYLVSVLVLPQHFHFLKPV